MTTSDAPTEVFIVGHRFDIKMNQDIPALGLMMWAEGEILLSSRLSGTQLRETLLHEIVHAADWSYARYAARREERDLPCPVKHSFDEPTIVHWSMAMFSTLSDPRNRRLVQWLFDIPTHPRLFTDGYSP